MVTSQARFVMRIVDLTPCSLLQPNTPLTLSNANCMTTISHPCKAQAILAPTQSQLIDL